MYKLIINFEHYMMHCDDTQYNHYKIDYTGESLTIRYSSREESPFVTITVAVFGSIS